MTLDRHGFCAMCEALTTRPIMHSARGMVVVPDGFPVVPGHALLLSARHIFSFASDPALVQNVDDALDVWCPRTSSCVVYEHGNTNWNQSSRVSVDHAHIHIAPSSHEQFAQVRATLGALHWISFASIRDALGSVHKQPYHLLGLAGGPVFVSHDKLPSQAFRGALGAASGSRSWDWKVVRAI